MPQKRYFNDQLPDITDVYNKKTHNTVFEVLYAALSSLAEKQRIMKGKGNAIRKCVDCDVLQRKLEIHVEDLVCALLGSEYKVVLITETEVTMDFS